MVSNESQQFFEWCEKMRKENPVPFPEDTRHYKEREKTVRYLYENKIPVQAYEHNRGGYSWEYEVTEGLIEEVTDGVWGYGGDPVAVKIKGEYYPSSQVRAKP